MAHGPVALTEGPRPVLSPAEHPARSARERSTGNLFVVPSLQPTGPQSSRLETVNANKPGPVLQVTTEALADVDAFRRAWAADALRICEVDFDPDADTTELWNLAHAAVARAVRTAATFNVGELR